MKNLYYFHTISAIGGIETFFYQLAKKYKDWDLTIVYSYADPIQLARLKQYVNCIQYTNQHFECERAFFNFNTDIIDHVKAKEYILVIHGDYKDMIEKGQLNEAPGHNKINRYVAVSELAKKSFTEVTGKPCELCYNPFELEKPKRILHLISATRLSREKGKNRMIKLGKMLDDAGIPYQWTVFTNDTKAIDNPNIVYMKPTLDILKYIADADYLVQLSDNEGYCYSVVEALSCGIPVIVTPCPVFDEIGVKHGENGFYVDFDMENVPIQDIYEKELKFNYTPKQDRWNELLVPGKSSYQEDLNSLYVVEALSTYQDVKMTDKFLERIPKPGEKWVVDKERYDILSGNNDKELVFVKLIKKIPKDEYSEESI